jgi:hypothetical protein
MAEAFHPMDPGQLQRLRVRRFSELLHRVAGSGQANERHRHPVGKAGKPSLGEMAVHSSPAMALAARFPKLLMAAGAGRAHIGQGDYRAGPLRPARRPSLDQPQRAGRGAEGGGKQAGKQRGGNHVAEVGAASPPGGAGYCELGGPGRVAAAATGCPPTTRHGRSCRRERDGRSVRKVGLADVESGML